MIFLLLILPLPDIAVDTFDLIEVNHVFSESEIDGLVYQTYTFTQLICWNLERDGEHHVAAWRMAKDLKSLPQFSHQKQTWTYQFNDGDRMRRIESRVYRETFTLFDPEVLDRQAWPQCCRAELSK